MYLEKEYLIKKINEFCSINNLNLTFDEKYKLSSKISRELDKNRILTFEEFEELLKHNEQIELLESYNINFDDEIESIEYIGYEESIDINVSGNHLFYANDILTHNSATGSTEADNSNVSDSMGSVMTSDLLLFLLQSPDMKERKEIVLKCTKNRYTGRTDTWMMNIDYTRMRFHDMVTENSVEHQKILDDLVNSDKTDALDFGIVTADKMKDATAFADSEVKNIAAKDFEILEKEKSNPLLDDTEELFRQLGIETE